MVEEVDMTALVDTRVQASAVLDGFCTEFALKIHPLGI